jgi:Flp pilus assembly protein TadB
VVTAALAGALFAAGLVVAVFACRAAPSQAVPSPLGSGARGREASNRSAGRGRPNWAAVGLGTALGFVVFAATGIPVFAIGAGLAAGLAPDLRRRRSSHNDERLRVEAIAAWTEMLRDAVASGRGVSEAISVTASLAPAALRPATMALRSRSVRGPLPAALRAFADDVSDPMADLVAAALILAATREVRELADLLGNLAQTTRQRAALRLSAEAGRAGMRTTARAVVGITAGALVALFALNPSYLAPYATPVGQLVALAAGAWFAVGLWGFSRLGRPPAARRIRLREVT